MSDWTDSVLKAGQRNEIYDATFQIVDGLKIGGFSRIEAMAMYDTIHFTAPEENRYIFQALNKLWKQEIFDKVYGND